MCPVTRRYAKVSTTSRAKLGSTYGIWVLRAEQAYAVKEVHRMESLVEVLGAVLEAVPEVASEEVRLEVHLEVLAFALCPEHQKSFLETQMDLEAEVVADSELDE